jgi:perosamine synthetase
MNVSAADRHASGRALIEQYLETGFNYRMTDVQAAIGLAQLDKLDQIVARRRRLASRYQEGLAAIPGLSTVTDPPYGTTNYQSFWIVLPDEAPVSRNQLLDLLLSRGISARRGIMAAHLEPAYLDWSRPELPVTEHLTTRSLILPLFHDLTVQGQDRVVAAISDAVGTGPPARLNSLREPPR